MNKKNGFHCDDCGRNLPNTSDISTGHGSRRDGTKSCYACCAQEDLEYMREHGRIALYLSWDGDGVPRNDSAHNAKVTNWPGSLVFDNHGRGLHVRRGKHNIAGVRYDTWFRGPDGFVWWGVSYGRWTQVVHCRRTKSRVF